MDAERERTIRVDYYLNEADFIIDLLSDFLSSGRTPSQEGVNPFAIMDFMIDRRGDERRCHEECANRCGCGQCHAACNDMDAFKPKRQVAFIGGANHV